MPALHWRQILSAHNTTTPGGVSVNQELEKLLVAGEDGHRLSLKMRNSYRCDDGLAVHTYTDDHTCSKSDAKAQVCKAALVELLLRAPNRGSVRLLDGAQLTRNGWSVERIWDEVRRIQLQMHGISGISEAPPMGGAGINAAPPIVPRRSKTRPSTAKQDTPIQPCHGPRRAAATPQGGAAPPAPPAPATVPTKVPPQEQRQMMWNKKKQSPSRPQRVAPQRCSTPSHGAPTAAHVNRIGTTNRRCRHRKQALFVFVGDSTGFIVHNF